MNRNFNPQIRQLTRLALQLPPEAPLPDCSWPTRLESCGLDRKKNLIESSSISNLVERYEIRSPPMERNECTVGPEIYNLLRNGRGLRTISEALAEIETKAGNIPQSQRGKFVSTIEGIVKEDMGRRSQIIMFYVAYFTISLLLFSYQIQRMTSVLDYPLLNNYALLILVNVIPLLASYVLHNKFAERVRGSGIIHLLPISLLLSVGVYNQVLAAGVANSTQKTLLLVSVAGGFLAGAYLLNSFRGVFADCAGKQRNVKFDPSNILIWGSAGILLPLIILFTAYLKL